MNLNVVHLSERIFNGLWHDQNTFFQQGHGKSEELKMTLLFSKGKIHPVASTKSEEVGRITPEH